MEHQGTKRLESGRLLLRQFKEEDAPAMYENWAGDPEVTRFLMWPTHTDIAVSQAVIGDWVVRYPEADYYLWAIVLKENGDMPIGSIGVVEKQDAIQMVHIGYCIGRKWWKQGITSAALAMLIKYFFTEVKVNRIESRHDPRNPNSGKVMEKCGLRYEGTKREADWNNQGRCDAAIYAILAKDYHILNQEF